jgi:23S rRNA (cytidine1920-2'-O)/16S rRNA (cytidine1409-2'-O)-methyltransferase
MNKHYVSRAGHKLDSVLALNTDFKDKTVLDVGSSTGGFTDYALQHGAQKVIAVELGTKQLHPSLIGNPLIELHEQTDIRSLNKLSERADIVVIDVSFVSLRDILPSVASLVDKNAVILAMVKPQFEATPEQKIKGIIKNDRIRRDILKQFELWARGQFVIGARTDSRIAGANGNLERFYLLRKI